MQKKEESTLREKVDGKVSKGVYAVLLFLGCFLFVGIQTSRSVKVVSAASERNSEYFVEINSYKSTSSEGTYVTILVDRETRVMYVQERFDRPYKGGIAIAPLYNADGTLRIYNGELP